MTILNDVQIEQLGETMISPFVSYKVSHTDTYKVISYGLGHFGYDIRLGQSPLLCMHEGALHRKNLPPINPKGVDGIPFTYLLLHKAELSNEQFFVLPPYAYALGVSVERFHLPNDISSIVIGKSTYARSGLIVNCTPMEAGWQGYLTIELFNATPYPLKVFADEGIAQAQFFRGSPCRTSYEQVRGKYQDQPQRPVPPKV